MTETRSDHLKFLRTPEHLETLTRLPCTPVSDPPSSNFPTLCDLLSDHMLLIVMSVYCDLCFSALDNLYVFLQAHPHYNAIMLIEADAQSYATVKEQFDGAAQVFRKTKHALMRELKLKGVPWGFSVNEKGEVMSSLPCPNTQDLEKLVQPLQPLLAR